MKEAMRKHFSLRKAEFEKGTSFLFVTSYNEEVASFIYQGEVNEDEEVQWEPLEKNIVHDLTLLEETLGVKLHSYVKDYFNAYWFAEIDGFVDNYYISLEGVLPNIELDSFQSNVEDYKSSHDYNFNNIPIGIEGNGLMVVINNEDGSVKLEDIEDGSFITLSTSLAELITDLRLKK